MKLDMRASAISCLVFVSFAHGQSDPIATLWRVKNLSNVPFTCQSTITPGTIIIVNRDNQHNADCSPASAKALSLPQDVPPVVLPGTKLALSEGGGLGLKLLGYTPAIKVTGGTTLESDQTSFTVKQLAYDDKLDDLIYREPSVKTIADGWLESGKDVYLVTGVYWATELNISSSKSTGVVLSNGKELPKCETHSPSNESNSAPKIGASARDGFTQLSTVSTALVKQAVSEVPSFDASICRDVTGTVHLKSATPIAVGANVVVLGYWSRPGEAPHFDYDIPKKPPIFK